jgi:ATP phosphoribosyltransferase
VGLADLIVDLVETGDTLRANGLVETRTILEVQAVLIANRAAYHLKRQAVEKVIDRLRHHLTEREKKETWNGGNH